jgi:glycosyltransferase involved in cell wall biosynthesis
MAPKEEISIPRMRSKYYMLKRTDSAIRKLRDLSNYDVVLQTSSIPFITYPLKKTYCIFIDFTMKLAEREYPQWATFHSEKDKNLWLELETKTYHNADYIFTASEHVKQSLIKDYKIPSENAVVVYEGVNINEIPDFEKYYGNKTILFVGMDFERKGGNILIKAFLEVKIKIPDAKLIIVGSNPVIDHPDILVKGYISREEMLNLYTTSAIFAMPSICEPFGLVFLEAMAYKLPCIGTTNDAMPEIIEDKVSGFLVPPHDYLILAEKIIILLNDEKLMESMGKKGRDKVKEKFTWDLVIERMNSKISLYKT